VKFFAFAAIAFYSFSAHAQTENASILLQDVRLIDGTGSPPKDHVSILIENGRISQIFTGVNAALHDSDAKVLSLTGKTVIPGLINGHGHLGLTEGTSVSPDNYSQENIEHQLAQYERYGVTTIMSLGMNKDLLYKLRSEQEKGSLNGATILTADRGIGTPGGVPAVKVGADQLYRPATAEEARADVREIAQRSPNLIKIWVDDSLHKLPAPKPAVYAAAIDEAHKLHLRVAAHVYYLSDAKRLLEDGVDILAHSIRDQEIDPDTVSLIKSKKVYYIPTLQLEESFFIYAGHSAWMDEPFFKDALNPELAEVLTFPSYKAGVQRDKTTPVHRAALQTAMGNIARLREAGLGDLIAFGTDSGANPFRIQGFAEHRELQLMVQSGMTPLEAIHSATSVNARMLNMSERIGTIEPGKEADLIVLGADPATDIKNTEKIEMVFHHGRQVKRE